MKTQTDKISLDKALQFAFYQDTPTLPLQLLLKPLQIAKNTYRYKPKHIELDTSNKSPPKPAVPKFKRNIISPRNQEEEDYYQDNQENSYSPHVTYRINVNIQSKNFKLDHKLDLKDTNITIRSKITSQKTSPSPARQNLNKVYLGNSLVARRKLNPYVVPRKRKESPNLYGLIEQTKMQHFSMLNNTLDNSTLIFRSASLIQKYQI